MHDFVATRTSPMHQMVRSESKADLLAEMKKCISYCPTTGEFTNIRGGNGKLKGSRMGTITVYGYAQISFKRKSYAAHRVAWLLSYGSFPPKELFIDHINGIRTDNRLSNLRLTTCAENLQNRRKAGVRSKTGLLGVFSYGNRYRARITTYGKTKNLGVFDSAEAAYAAYVEAKRKLHRTCTI